MELQKLLILKDKLVTAEDFNEPWTYFFDHFGTDPEFMNLGHKADPTFLEEIIQQVGQQLFQGNVTLSAMLLTEIQDYQFLHGTCVLQGNRGSRLVTIMYFKDIDVGMLALTSSPMSGQVLFARFSTIKIHGDQTPMFRPWRDKTRH